MPLWWDRGVDRTGRTIRPDVRKAALSVWRSTCRRTQAVLSDPSQAAELMEGTVAQLSRYLDRKDIAVFSREIEGLVAHSFRRAVQREVVKRNRLVALDGSGGLSNHVSDETWRRQVHARLELQELVGFLVDSKSAFFNGAEIRSRIVASMRCRVVRPLSLSQDVSVPLPVPARSAAETAYWDGERGMWGRHRP